jgi:hypothetical protein
MLSSDLVVKSFGDMKSEMLALFAEAEKLARSSEESLVRSEQLRIESVDRRSADPKAAEELWQKAEDERALSKEMMRQSVESQLKAKDIEHRLKIHDQIESVNRDADIAWQRASKAARL